MNSITDSLIACSAGPSRKVDVRPAPPHVCVWSSVGWASPRHTSCPKPVRCNFGFWHLLKDALPYVRSQICLPILLLLTKLGFNSTVPCLTSSHPSWKEKKRKTSKTKFTASVLKQDRTSQSMHMFSGYTSFFKQPTDRCTMINENCLLILLG